MTGILASLKLNLVAVIFDVMLFKAFTQSLRVLTNFKVTLPFNLPYWVEITTRQPQCIYYFGPFKDRTEAKKMQHGYIEDLVAEKALGMKVEIKRCLPTNLTIDNEE